MRELLLFVLERTSTKLISFIFLPFNTLQSKTYFYPCVGIHYFFTHPDLWGLYLTLFIPQLMLTLFIYILMYITLYPIQAIVLTLITGPIGLLNAWITVLQQSGLISIFIVTNLMMPEIQRIAFDAVLSREFSDDVVMMAKLRRIEQVPFLVKCGRILWSIPRLLIFPFMVFKAILLFFISMIPICGPILVIVLQAPSKGFQSHSRYYALKGYNKGQIRLMYKENMAGYTGFGITANVLEQVPILSVFFMFTNTVGAALWVVDLEMKQKSLMENESVLDPLNTKELDNNPTRREMKDT